VSDIFLFQDLDERRKMSPGVQKEKKKFSKSGDDIRPSSSTSVAPEITVKDRAKALIALQSFEGSFSLTSALASTLQVPLADLDAKLKTSPSKLGEEDKKKLWATVLAVCLFENKLRGEKDMWELVVEKANDWMSGLSSVQTTYVAELKRLAGEMLGA
jgi:hypothetical protein